MTPAQLEAICLQFYGHGWQTTLAMDIARERETVNRWARGRSPIPKAVVRWLEEQLKRRKDHTSPYRGYTWEDVAMLLQENRVLKEQLQTSKGSGGL
jgi:hypothetical protein